MTLILFTHVLSSQSSSAPVGIAIDMLLGRILSMQADELSGPSVTVYESPLHSGARRFSEHFRHALRWADALARRYDSRLTIVTVIGQLFATQRAFNWVRTLSD
jgi:hypothetical protein